MRKRKNKIEAMVDKVGVEVARKAVEAIESGEMKWVEYEEIERAVDEGIDTASEDMVDGGSEGIIETGGIDGAMKEIEELIKGMDKERLEELEESLKIELARNEDSPDGFSAYYEIVVGEKIPRHCREWIERIYEAHRAGRGIVIKAFRGSRKTTVVTVLYTAWRIGREPEKTNIIIQVGNPIAKDTTKKIADIIQSNEGYRKIFSNIEPDILLGWGAGGYYVKRVDIEYTKWRGMMVNVKDPTFIGLGVESSEIIGKHPTGLLVIDDIHDENNTGSKKELANVKKVLQDTILPTIINETRQIVIGTPWVEDDALNYLAATGEYDIVNMPIYKEVGDGENVEENGFDIVNMNGRLVRLSFPEVMTAEEIQKRRRLTTESGFARMYLLDLKSKEGGTKYYLYPHERTQYNWVVIGGADYAGTANPYRNIEGKNDYFALCYLAKLPGGGAVVLDGILERCTQAEAEYHILKAQNIFPGWQLTVIESDGKGEEFIQILRRHPGLKILPVRSKGRAKAERLRVGLFPWLENGMIKISDAETPFLNELRNELDSFPFSEHDDAMDALYCAARGMPDVLSVGYEIGEETEIGDGGMPLFAKRKSKNPFLSLGMSIRKKR